MANKDGELIGGRYRLVELIGQGGMGRVWRGRDETLERDVAVKEVMFPQGITADQREVLLQRVLREARAAARLNHPGIITVHDVVEHAGAPVIVMEYVAGMSLAAAIEQSGGLPVRRVAEIGAAMLRALSRAHAAGIIHRDLKPDNVLLMDDRVIITDFGIAHLVDSTMALTHTGTLIGTPAYMAPEQLSGQTPAPATDLWSLGATLYCAVEGEPPFSAETFTALCIAVVTGMPRPALRAEGLWVVLEALLTKDPVQRAGTAQALTALEEVARTGGVAYVPTRVDTPPTPAPGVGPAEPGALIPGAPARPTQPPMAGGPAPWGGGPIPWTAPPRPRAHASAAVIAGTLALLTACMLGWFALHSVVYATGPTGRWSSLVWENVVGGVISAGLLVVPARFTFDRRPSGAWTLCALCVLYVVAILVLGPLQGTTTFGAQFKFVFGFDKSDGVAIGLATIFAFLTAIAAVIAARVRSPQR
ncbi:serine/threonine-protein kinase [Streptomyces beijiangensis]|uniref:non-specific serine/threonine protein kinase n=1 Tax=Streptomyces beijiangensis TaxID=163361 RepID=A0A939F7G9_9ACTN|nr:serine/threonine-protein kinase [Streptomyces beijiangensis]MBO0513014.1 protein kinase [Streptomyces beijiangensis]